MDKNKTDDFIVPEDWRVMKTRKIQRDRLCWKSLASERTTWRPKMLFKDVFEKSLFSFYFISEIFDFDEAWLFCFEMIHGKLGTFLNKNRNFSLVLSAMLRTYWRMVLGWITNLYNNCLVAKLGTASTGNFLSGKAETPNLLNS